jgi:co-chaperonin GroES (HSP10)
MRIENVKKVKPAKENVVVRNIELGERDGIYIATEDPGDYKDSPLRFSEVISVGPLAENVDQCPGVKPGDTVVHNLFAGAHIATDDVAELYKILDGYSLIAILDDIHKLNESTIKPTANRLLLAVKYMAETENGLFLSRDEAKDARLEDLAYGVILKVGPSCKLGYNVGDIVAYNPYAGETIRQAESADIPALRVLIEEDVLLTI